MFNYSIFIFIDFSRWSPILAFIVILTMSGVSGQEEFGENTLAVEEVAHANTLFTNDLYKVN